MQNDEKKNCYLSLYIIMILQMIILHDVSNTNYTITVRLYNTVHYTVQII